MDIVYFLKHSRRDDLEIRFSLRSVERNMPWINKVWIFGDRPSFLSTDTSIVEHVPHEYVARVGPFRTPVTNFFLLFYLSSLIPRLSHEFLHFSDDYVILEPLSPEDSKKARVLEDLSKSQSRGKGLWKESLWRTYDLLKRLGYPGWNFETHVPTYFTKTRVLEAYCDFRDFITQDRWYGMLGITAILNHALKKEAMPLVCLAEEGRKIGFYGTPIPYDDIVEKCKNKTFLNFDDDAFDDNLLRYLNELLPNPSKYESSAAAVPESDEASLGRLKPPLWPDNAGNRIAVVLSKSPSLPALLTQLSRLPAVSVVVCTDADKVLQSDSGGARVRITTSTGVDIRQLAERCDLAISDGTGLFAQLVIQGQKPHLCLPTDGSMLSAPTKGAADELSLYADTSDPHEVIARLRQLWERLMSSGKAPVDKQDPKNV